MPEPKPKRWRHARKGLITGHVVGGDADWMRIKLVGEHRPKFNSIANQGAVWEDGAVVTVRKILMEEL